MRLTKRVARGLLGRLRIWRAIARPKLDVTSFGHWTGTGLVEWPRS